MFRTLSLLALVSSSFATLAEAKVNFAMDERGFEACYDSFVQRVRPGTPISSKAFSAIADALEERGNVLQKMEARNNQEVVLNVRKRKAFMDNVQGKGQAQKRARVDNDFFQAPVNQPAPAAVDNAQSRKRAWRQRYDVKIVAPVANLIDRQDAMDFIEEMFMPTPRNITFLATPKNVQNAPLTVQTPANARLHRQNADVGALLMATPQQKLHVTAVVENAPLAFETPATPAPVAPESMVKSRIAFWENITR